MEPELNSPDNSQKGNPQSIWAIASGPELALRDASFLEILELYLLVSSAGSLLLFGLFSSCRQWGLLSSCSAWASHCSGFSYCGVWALGHMGLGSRGSQAPEHRLKVEVHGFTCPAAYGVFLDQGWHSSFLHWQILYHWATPEVQRCFLKDRSCPSSTQRWVCQWVCLPCPLVTGSRPTRAVAPDHVSFLVT